MSQGLARNPWKEKEKELTPDEANRRGLWAKTVNQILVKEMLKYPLTTGPKTLHIV